MKIAVHITHEAMKKVGGIGAVLNGICPSKAYKSFFEKTVLYGPLFTTREEVQETVDVLYSSMDGCDKGSYGEVFEDIRRKYNVDIVYGKRKLTDEFDGVKENIADVILVGIGSMNKAEVGKFKFELWQKFGIQSELYSKDWDYEQYLRIAVPFLEILNKMYGADAEFYDFSHEYMGVPSALAAVLQSATNTMARQGIHKTIFVAHEVSTARFLVESSPGHDIDFYNKLRKEKGKRSLEQVFGSQKQSPRNELIKQAVNFDRILAVSDLIKEEYLFLVPDTPAQKIRTAYNGLSIQNISIDRKRQSHKLIEEYVDSLFGFKPDVVLTHVTRLVISKGLWRDITLLYYLDEIFQSKNLKGIYILFATFVVTGRPSSDIFKMEKEYGWPVEHRYGWPDLVGMEEEIYSYLQVFNQKSKAIKGLFINQFGFNREKCGMRVPEDARFIDLRIASDAEFGFSTYEPFGIAQLETIPFGGTAILSSSCGSVSLLDEVFKNAKLKPYYVLDFISKGRGIKNLTIENRTEIERELFKEHAKSIFEILPVTEEKRAKYLKNTLLYNPRLGWENIVKTYLLPNLPT